MLFRLLLIALLTPSLTLAQSGLLVGLRYIEGTSASPDSAYVPVYRTLWIAPVDGKLAVAATLPALVVPRDDGFWQMDIEPSCGITNATMEVEGPFLDTFQTAVWRRWRTARPFASAADNCAKIASDLRATVIDSSRAIDEDEACNVREIDINYAGPKYVSYVIYTAHTEFCSPGRYTSSTRLSVLNSSDTVVAGWRDSSVSLIQALPPERAASLQERWAAGKSDCTFEETPDENWGIIRGVGEWTTDFSSTGPTVCRGEGMSEFNIRDRIPPSLARSEPRQWLPRIRKVAPKVDDFFVSPRVDVVGVRSGDQLIVFATRGETLGQPVLRYTLRPEERVILVEWAVGSHVERWTRTLTEVQPAKQ